jgi:hypothetical protein
MLSPLSPAVKVPSSAREKESRCEGVNIDGHRSTGRSGDVDGTRGLG